MTKKRICITIDYDLIKELREIQSEKIKDSHNSVSLSSVLENFVRMGLKK